MPVGKAARAIGSASADGPTDRLLLYLHPSPGVPDASAAKQALEVRGELAAHGARPFDVIRTTIRSLRTKSLLDDLQAIEAHNESVEQQLTDRDRLLAPITSSTPPPTVETSSVIAPELDAVRLVDLFASPWDHVAESVPPVEFAPQAGGRNGEGLDRLVRRLAHELATTTLPRARPSGVRRALAATLGRGHPDRLAAHRVVPVRRRGRAASSMPSAPRSCASTSCAMPRCARPPSSTSTRSRRSRTFPPTTPRRRGRSCSDESRR